MKRAFKFVARIVASVFSRNRRENTDSTHRFLSVSKIAYGIEYVRTLLAPLYRQSARFGIVLLGFAVFAGLELLTGYAINMDRGALVLGLLFGIACLAVAVAWPIVGFVVWLIVSPIAAGFLQADTQGNLPTITFDVVMIYSLFLIVAVRSLAARKKPRRVRPAEWLLLSFVMYVFVSAWFRGQMADLNTFRFFMSNIGVWVVLYVIALGVIRNVSHIKWVMIGIVFAGLFQGASLIYEQLTGDAWRSIFWQIIYGVRVPLEYLGWGDIGVGRSVGMFQSPVSPSVFSPMAACFALLLASITKNSWAKLFYYCVVGVVVIGSYYTYTRNVYAILLLFVILMPFLANRLRRQFSMFAILGLVALVILAPIWLMNKDFNKRMTDQGNILLRLAYMKTAINMIEDNPVFGVGWRNYLSAARYYVATPKESWSSRDRKTGLMVPTFVHNAYLYMTCEHGFVGSGFYFGCLFAFLITLLRLRFSMKTADPWGKDLVSIVATFSICLFVQYISYSIHYATYTNYIVWISFALAVRYYEMSQEAQQETTGLPEDSDKLQLPERRIPVGV